jgi:hypothetical protein
MAPVKNRRQTHWGLDKGGNDYAANIIEKHAISRKIIEQEPTFPFCKG